MKFYPKSFFREFSALVSVSWHKIIFYYYHQDDYSTGWTVIISVNLWFHRDELAQASVKWLASAVSNLLLVVFSSTNYTHFSVIKKIK